MKTAVDIVLRAEAGCGEGPVWDDEQGCLLWVDIEPGRLHRTRPDGSDDVADAGQPVGAVVLRRDGGLLLAARDGFARFAWDTPSFELVVPVEPGIASNRMNDGKCDPRGRFLAGTMAVDEAPGAGTLYRLDPDWSVAPLVRDVTISNGLAWSADGGTLFYVDSPTCRVDAFPYDLDTGTLGARRTHATFPGEWGLPDGMAIDSDDHLWVAFWGGSAVRRVAPDGTIADTITLPASQITSCAFGGAGFDELYITSARQDLSADRLSAEPEAGAVFVARPGASGRPADRFAA